MKKKLLAFLVIVVIVIGLNLVWKYRTFHPASSKFPIVDATLPLKERAEEKLLQSLYAPDALAKACSLNLLGNDEKYVYASGICEDNFRGSDGELAIGGLMIGPVRFFYTGSDFVLTGSEYATSVCPKCGGTKPEDILPPTFYAKYASTFSDEEDRVLRKENKQKLFGNSPITKEIAILLATEDWHVGESAHLRSSGQWPGGRSDAVADGGTTWDVALYYYMGVEPAGSEESGVVVCYKVAPDTTVTRIREYIPQEKGVTQTVDPKTCLSS